jgi:hypothetical protein
METFIQINLQGDHLMTLEIFKRAQAIRDEIQDANSMITALGLEGSFTATVTSTTGMAQPITGAFTPNNLALMKIFFEQRIVELEKEFSSLCGPEHPVTPKKNPPKKRTSAQATKKPAPKKVPSQTT